MFGLSTWEILIILVVALIFVGPDQLPKVARQIGKGVRQVRGAVGKVDDEMRRAMREAAAELDDEGKPVVPPPSRPVPPPPAPLPSEPPRDWTQVGKGAVPGRVATATPARPRPEGAAAPGEASAASASSVATDPGAAADDRHDSPTDPSPPVT